MSQTGLQAEINLAKVTQHIHQKRFQVSQLMAGTEIKTLELDLGMVLHENVVLSYWQLT